MGVSMLDSAWHNKYAASMLNIGLVEFKRVRLQSNYSHLPAFAAVKLNDSEP